jgi:hypothetical protein
LSFTSNNENDTTKDSNNSDNSNSQTRPKRKIHAHNATGPNKKQKTAKKTTKENIIDKLVQTKVVEEIVLEKTETITAVSDEATAITKDTVEKPDEMTKVADQEIHEETKEQVEQVVQVVQPNTNEEDKKDTQTETYHFEQEIELKSSLSYSTASACSLVEDDSFTLDTPSPSFHSDPLTPPPHNDDSFSVSAPYKTILSPVNIREKLVIL